MRVHLAMLCVLGLSAPRAGWAADAPTPAQETTVMTDKARQLYEEGLSAYKKGKFLEAHASFLAAWSLNRHWQIAANLADTELELGKYRDAAGHAAYYQKNAPANRQEKADALLKRALARVATLVVAVDPPGAEVLVDDVPLGRAPLAEGLYVEPGAHKVTARLAGRPDAVAAVTADAGTAQRVALKVPTEDKPPAPPPVTATVQGPNRAIVIGGAVVGGVGVAIGVGLSIASAMKGSAADVQLTTLQQSGSTKPCPTNMAVCSAIDSDRRAHDALGKGAVGAFVAGGAVGLATLGYTLLAPKGSVTTGTRLAPVVARDRAGVVVMGVW